MTAWKYTDATERVVSRTLADGCIESCLVDAIADWLDLGNTPEPADVPPLIIPQTVTMRQARLALLQAGLLVTVNAAVAGMPGAAGEAARIEWEYSQEVRRDKVLVLALAPVLGLSDAQLDALFVAAAGL